MRKIIYAIVVWAVALGQGTAVFAGSSRRDLEKELKNIETGLKPLRQRAEQAPQVIAERKKLDAAFRRYYAKLRSTMGEMAPDQKPAIERSLEIREKLFGESGGGRAGAKKGKRAVATAQATAAAR